MFDMSLGLQVVRAGIGNYLSEAAAAIFSPQTSDVPWDGSTSGWSGGEALKEHKTNYQPGSASSYAGSPTRASASSLSVGHSSHESCMNHAPCTQFLACDCDPVWVR